MMLNSAYFLPGTSALVPLPPSALPPTPPVPLPPSAPTPQCPYPPVPLPPSAPTPQCPYPPVPLPPSALYLLLVRILVLGTQLYSIGIPGVSTKYPHIASAYFQSPFKVCRSIIQPLSTIHTVLITLHCGDSSWNRCTS